MKCTTIKMPDGMVVTYCGSKRPPARCKKCGKPSTKLCDFPAGDGKTCDKPLCGACAVKIAPDVDHCPDHPRGDLLL